MDGKCMEEGGWRCIYTYVQYLSSASSQLQTNYSSFNHQPSTITITRDGNGILTFSTGASSPLPPFDPVQWVHPSPPVTTSQNQQIQPSRTRARSLAIYAMPCDAMPCHDATQAAAVCVVAVADFSGKARGIYQYNPVQLQYTGRFNFVFCACSWQPPFPAPLLQDYCTYLSTTRTLFDIQENPKTITMN